MISQDTFDEEILVQIFDTIHVQTTGLVFPDNNTHLSVILLFVSNQCQNILQLDQFVSSYPNTVFSVINVDQFQQNNRTLTEPILLFFVF